MPKVKLYTHWIGLDPEYLEKANRAFRDSSGVAVKRVYNHPDGIHSVFEVVSTAPYASLDLDVNSLTSPLRRYSRKPAGLGPGMPLRGFDKIYGRIAIDEYTE